MEEDGKHKHKQPRGSSSSGAASGSSWKLDPAIERRLSGQSSFSFAEGTPETRNNNDDDDDVAVVAASSTPSPIFGLSRTTGLALPSYDMYSNIPELNSDNARRQESFSSLPVPNLGSQPHSRRQTPADAGWMETLDLTRLFFGLGKPRGQLDGFDESLTPLQTPEKGRRSKRSTPGSKHGQGGANLSSRLLEDEDEDSDHSFRETIEGIDGGKGSEPTDHSLAFDAHIRSRSGSWLSRLWNKHFDSRNYYNSEFRARDYESDYLALVPLSDPRLSKRWPLWVFVLLVVLFSASVFCGVFFFVQRQVAVNQGEIVTKTSSIHVNPLKPGDYHGSYTLDLEIDIPVHNQNYFPAKVSGGIGIYLYNYKGGEVSLDVAVPSRTTQIFTVNANASDFDSAVTSTIIGRCTFLQPHLLQFVLKGNFTTEVLFYPTQITQINTYAIVDCKIED